MSTLIHASTVSREVNRNRDDAGRYRPFAAHRLALRRLVRPKERRLATDLVLRDTVQGWLDRRWSPERIAQQLRSDFPENHSWHLVPESIYQAIYAKDGPCDETSSPACAANTAVAGRTGTPTRGGLAA